VVYDSDHNQTEARVQVQPTTVISVNFLPPLFLCCYNGCGCRPTNRQELCWPFFTLALNGIKFDLLV